jgi:5-methylcytosine-specific restriction endonuclease McrA
VLARANFTCQACGEKVPKIRLEIDHIIPVSQGGLTVSENLQALCVACNRGKAAKMKAMRKVQPQAKPKKAKPKKGKKPKKSQS